MTAATTGSASAGGPYRYATSADVGNRLTVCAEDLTVREFIGVLKRGQTFEVKGFNTGEWVYGFAYGNVNANGWVQNGWFC
ncbi:hypothetical protein ADL03_13615 [Nocardia sp. NRRL S-836]|nr:hypothetical protein ADL03_13615 [Nocardia sp. NRRL S-836]